MRERVRTIGACLDAALEEVTEEWFRENVGLRTREEALVHDVRSIVGTVELLRGGRVKTFAAVIGAGHRDTVNHGIEWQRQDPRGYVRKAHEPKG